MHCTYSLIFIKVDVFGIAQRIDLIIDENTLFTDRKNGRGQFTFFLHIN